MKKEELLKSASKIVMAFSALEIMGKTDNLVKVAYGMGYTGDRVTEAIKFLHSNVTEEEMNTVVERDAHIAYLEAIDELEKYAEMAKGYQEMGDINLKISQEDHHLEEEGAKLHEVVAEDSEGDTEAG